MTEIKRKTRRLDATSKGTNALKFVERRHVVPRMHSSARRNALIKRTTRGTVSVLQRDGKRAKSVLESRSSAFVYHFQVTHRQRSDRAKIS